MQIEVVYAIPSRQELIELDVAAPLTVGDAIRRSGIEDRFPGEDLASAEVGIWGRPVSRDTLAVDGDRVEIYRPLERDPRDARRLRAQSESARAPRGASSPTRR